MNSGRGPLKHLLILAVLGILIAAGYRLLTHFDAPTSPPLAEPPPPPQVDLALQQVRYTETRDGLKLWSLVADRVSVERSMDLSSIQGIHLTFFNAGGDEEVKLEAEEGSVLLEKREVEVWGDVKATSPDGLEIRAERLRYRQADGTLSSAGPVELTRPGIRMTGVGFNYQVEERTLSILSQVKATVWPDTLPALDN